MKSSQELLRSLRLDEFVVDDAACRSEVEVQARNVAVATVMDTRASTAGHEDDAKKRMSGENMLNYGTTMSSQEFLEAYGFLARSVGYKSRGTPTSGLVSHSL